MAITVQMLIAQLKKMPPRAKVCWCDHDHDYDSGELNGPVRGVIEAPPAIKARGFGVILS